MSRQTLIVRYALFSVVATFANLGTQRVVLIGGTTELKLGIAVLMGTLVGLVLKYLLDKRWIFLDDTAGTVAQGKQFGLYAAAGVVTTVVFWAAEIGFWLVWGTDQMREIGGVLGLIVGYCLKYQLDRRYVFVNA
ncbi:GtrA family protein [Vannielia sp. SX4]|uniref:GtrA family protein n=1 Tax=Vannielia sp. SX4 TaxID=3463852 RepID=UPI004057D8CC